MVILCKSSVFRPIVVLKGVSGSLVAGAVAEPELEEERTLAVREWSEFELAEAHSRIAAAAAAAVAPVFGVPALAAGIVAVVAGN